MSTMDFSNAAWLVLAFSSAILLAGVLFWHQALFLKHENAELAQKQAEMAAELVTTQELLQRKNAPALFSMEEVASILALDTMRAQGMYCDEDGIAQGGMTMSDERKQRVQMEALRKLSLVLSQHKDDPLFMEMGVDFSSQASDARLLTHSG